MQVEVSELTPSLKLYRVGLINYYLFMGEKNVLIETGLTCTAEKLLEELEENVDAVIITHSHFDHIAGLSVILEQYPDAEVAGHEKIAPLLEKEKVIKSWYSDNSHFCKEEVQEPNLRLDRGLKEGDTFYGLEIFEFPGHAPDSIGVYSRKENALLVTDCLGYFTSSGRIVPLFFYNYQQYLDSIQRISGFRPQVLGVGHLRVFRGRECDQAIKDAYDEAVKLGNMIKSEMSDEELIDYFFVDELRLYPEQAMKVSAGLLKRRVLES